MRKLTVNIYSCCITKVIWLSCLLFSLQSQAQETLRITVGEWSPYLSKELPHNGFLARIITEAFAYEDIAVQWHFFPWSRAMLYAKRGKAEASAVWRHSDERDRHFVYSDSILTSANVFFHLKKRSFDWDNIHQLKGLTIGTTTSYSYGSTFDKAAADGLFNIDTTPSELQNFKKLLRGKIDLLPSNKFVGHQILMEQLGAQQAKRLTYHPKYIQPKTLHLLFSRVTGNSKYFSKRFNAGLKKLRISGKYKQYMNLYLPKID